MDHAPLATFWKVAKGSILNEYGELCSITYDARLAYADTQEVDFFQTCIEKNSGRVLEAMCGSGRLLIPLFTRGYAIDGVDYSSSMLARCLARCAYLQIIPELYKQSLEDLSIPHKYHTVIIALASFQLICNYDDALLILKNLNAHMHENANIFIDIFIPEVDDNGDSVTIHNIDNTHSVRLTKKYNYIKQDHIAQALCTYELIANNIIIEKEQELLQLVWYTDTQWESLLSAAGFKIIKIYDYAYDNYSRVIHAQKK